MEYDPLAWLDADLERLERNHLLRRPTVRAGAAGALIEIGGRHLINFGANDYLGQSWVLEGQPASEAPQLLFTEGMEPEEGSNVFIQCESEICPENRQCGPLDNPTSVCCERDEYCQPDPMGISVGTCVCRPDFDCS